MSTNYVQTPFGHVGRYLIDKFKKVTGLVERNGHWVILQEFLDGWVKNKDDRGREKWIRGEVKLPVRYYNFEYAMAKNNGDINQAIKYAEEKLFDHQGKPVYLPDLIAAKAGLHTIERHFNYVKILDEAVKMARL